MAPCGWSQRFSLACHCPYQYPSSPGFFCCFARCLGCAALLSLWLCAHLQLGRSFLMLPACPSPSFGLLVYWFPWLLFSTRVPYLRNGVTPAGSRIVCPRSEWRFSLSIWVRHAGQFLAGPPSAGICAPCHSGCVARWSSLCPYPSVNLALSRVLHCPLLGCSVASPAVARGLVLSFVPYPLFCRLGLVPRSVAQLCALQPLMPSFRVYLSEAAGFGGFLVLSVVLPWP